MVNKLSQAEKYTDFNQIMGSVDVPISEVFNKGRSLLNNNDQGVINKKIRDKILDMTLNKKASDPKSEINTMNTGEATETNDLIRKIFDMDNQIFTNSVSHELLCKNLKYELIKLIEDNKPVSMIVRDFNITSKKNN
jgi:hypothetical protein